MCLRLEKSELPWVLLRRPCLRSAGWRASCRSMKSCRRRRQGAIPQLKQRGRCAARKEYREMATEEPREFPAFRVIVMLIVLVNLVLTVALVMQVRELQ